MIHLARKKVFTGFSPDLVPNAVALAENV